MRIGWVPAIVVLANAQAAYAGDKPLFAPVPAWVKPAPEIDANALTDKAPILVRFDNQQRFEHGTTTVYLDAATRAASPELLNAIGTIAIPWNPDHGDLTIHKLEIIRGAEHIDLLKTGKFTVLRREQQLDKRVLDGVLTATMAAEGLRVGDVLHMTISVTTSDAVLKGNVQSGMVLLAEPVHIAFGRIRLVWPKGDTLNWRAYLPGVDAKPILAGDNNELNIALPLAKPAEQPEDVPARARLLPLIDVSSFSSWEQVSAVMAPLYETKGLIDPASPLAAEIAAIKKGPADPLVRAAAALQLVQDKLRYQLMGMGTGNYVPQTPAQSWTLRYGDCKAKTLLLLAILRELGIEAEPVLANLSGLGDAVARRLPSAGVFDHILVHARVNGEDLWLDGTGSGSRLEDIHDVPPLGFVLPVRAAGAALIELPHRAPARADKVARIEFDETAGANLPYPFKITLVVRDQAAGELRVLAAQGDKDALAQEVEKRVQQNITDARVFSHSLQFDESTGTATLVAEGIGFSTWSKTEDRLKSEQAPLFYDASYSPDRTRTAWHDLPVATGSPWRHDIQLRVRLPQDGKGFSIEGDAHASVRAAAWTAARDATITGNTATITFTRTSDASNIAAADLPEMRRILAASTARPLRLVAPADYPSQHAEAVAARRAPAMKTLFDGLAKRIADKPDDTSRLIDRAWTFEQLYDYRGAIADYDKVIAINPSADSYLTRAQLHYTVGDYAKEKADAVAARAVDPESVPALIRLAQASAELGDRDGARAMLQERIDQGGDQVTEMLAALSEIEIGAGNGDAAIAAADKGVMLKPGKPGPLNQRCWAKGLANRLLDTALKDCTKAIELSDSPWGALDSRALVYFRLNRMEDALADLNAVLNAQPDLASSLFLRGVVLRKLGKTREGDADLAAARLIVPNIATLYQHAGIMP